MTDSEDNIRKIAAGKLAQFGMDPPPDMWERIEKQMRRRKRLTLLWYVAMAASVLVLLAVGYSLLMPYPGKTDKQTAQSHKSVDPSVKTGNSEISRNLHSADSGLQKQLHTETGTSGIILKSVTPDPEINDQPTGMLTWEDHLPAPAAENKTTLSVVSLPVSDGEIPASVVDSVAEPVIVSIESAKSLDNDQQISLVQDQGFIRDTGKPESDRNRNRQWGLSLAYGTTPAIEVSQEEASLASTGSSYTLDEFSSVVAEETAYFSTIENTTHHAPLTIGFLANRRIAGKWDIESGLIYTKLGYVIRTTEMSSVYYEYHNELYYLGVPIGIRFRIIDRKRFGLYAGQSLIIEKGIAGRVVTDTYNHQIISGTETEKAGIRGIQLSSLTGLGVDVKLAGKFAVYGQSGLQLFFMNGTQPYNIRSARMAWPSFQVGLRMKLE